MKTRSEVISLFSEFVKANGLKVPDLVTVAELSLREVSAQQMVPRDPRIPWLIADVMRLIPPAPTLEGGT